MKVKLKPKRIYRLCALPHPLTLFYSYLRVSAAGYAADCRPQCANLDYFYAGLPTGTYPLVLFFHFIRPPMPNAAPLRAAKHRWWISSFDVVCVDELGTYSTSTVVLGIRP